MNEPFTPFFILLSPQRFTHRGAGVCFAFLKENKYGEVLSDECLDAMLSKFTFALASQELYPLLLQ